MYIMQTNKLTSGTDFATFLTACVEFEAPERRDDARGIVIRQLEEMIVEPR